jgi:Family of unknown function (DUF6505)
MIPAFAVPGLGEEKMLKLPRTIRLDPSDTFVFERAANPGEWAVSGAFVFRECNNPADLDQKQRVALRSGFLGIESLGWSTLAIVTEATEADMQRAVERLAAHLLAQFGAPDLQGRSRSGGRRDRLRNFPLRSPAPDDTRCAAQRREWRDP